jgi:2-polyprenyl-3-methyl-5-hydroxy-6-metoxy-1,4-benzoquinol methylase
MNLQQNSLLTGNQELLPSGMYKKLLLDRIFRRFDFGNPVLEVGCATGEFLCELATRGFEGVGIDLSADSLAAAKKRTSSLPFHIKRGSFMKLEEDDFGTIFIFEVLEHIEDDASALKKLSHMLRMDGKLVLSVPAKQNLYTAEDSFQGHVRRYERDELMGKLEAAGFHPDLFWCYNPLPYFRKYIMRGQSNEVATPAENEERTKESSYSMDPFTGKWVKRLYPIYSRLRFLLRIQDVFLNTDFGAHYLVVASKSGNTPTPQ